MGFYEDLEKSLLEAIEIEKGHIPMEEKKGLPAPTFFAAEKEKYLVDELVFIRKSHNVSQTELAKLTGSKQQAISRIENKEHSPSLKLFSSMAYALGYELELVKRKVE